MFRRLVVLLCAVACTISVVAPTPVSASSGAAKSCTKSYVAKNGDSWWRVATKVKVTLKALLKANNARKSTFLGVGQRICLPSNAVVNAPPKVQAYIRPDRFYSANKSKEIIKSVFPASQVENAYKIAWRESHLMPQNQNLDGCGGTGCYGLFQIHWGAHKSWMLTFNGWKVYKWCKIRTRKDLLYAECNAEIALEMYRRSGNSWKPWGGVPK